jgi:hypothetical protein
MAVIVPRDREVSLGLVQLLDELSARGVTIWRSAAGSFSAQMEEHRPSVESAGRFVSQTRIEGVWEQTVRDD